MAVDSINYVNFALNLAIIAVGYAAYRKTYERMPLTIAGAFVVFAFSYVLVFLENDVFKAPIAVLRVIGYFTIIYALYASMPKAKKK